MLFKEVSNRFEFITHLCDLKYKLCLKQIHLQRDIIGICTHTVMCVYTKKKQITRKAQYLSLKAASISLRCSPLRSSDIQTNLNWELGPALFSVSKRNTITQLRCEARPAGLHTHTLFGASLLSSLCCPQRSILLLQLKSLLEVSYGVGHTMQICDCRCAFGPSNYPKPQ